MASTDSLLTWRRGFFVENGIEYPTSEGRYLMGTPLHVLAVRSAMDVLSRHFGDRADLFVNAVNPICYDPVDLKQFVIPDLMVARGQQGGDEEVYRTWAAPVPLFVLEVASVPTWDRELEFKKEEYELLGVKEYWQLDQSGMLLEKPLMGHRLTERGYRLIRPSGRREEEPEYWSEALDLYLRARRRQGGLTVQFRCPRTGEDLPTDEDLTKALQSMWEEIAKLDQKTEEVKRQTRKDRAARLALQQQVEDHRAARLALQQQVEDHRAARLALQQQVEDHRAARLALQQQVEKDKTQVRELQAAILAAERRATSSQEGIRKFTARSRLYPHEGSRRLPTGRLLNAKSSG